MATIDGSNVGTAPTSYQQLLSQLHGMTSTAPAAPAPAASTMPGDSYVSSQPPAPAAPNAPPAPTAGSGLLSQLHQLLQQVAGKPAAPASPAPAPSAPTPAPQPAPEPAKPNPPAASRTYTVRSGDSLSAIARRELGDGNRWGEIYDLNRNQISDPNLIYPGQVLQLPDGAVPEPAPAPSPAPQPPSGHSGEPWSPGPGELHGGDTSNWNSNGTFQESLQGAKWTAIKASQGTGFVDATFRSRWDQLGKQLQDGSLKLRMAYEFLDPGDGTAQAKHFLDVVGIHGPLPAGTRLVLDWEGPALDSPSTLKQAAEHIRQVTGDWPVIYVQGSKMDVAKATVPGAPIWEAAYGSGINRDVAFFQYSDGPNYDHDVFNGNLAALERFAGWA